MPCVSDYLQPTSREKESVRVRRFMKEIGRLTPVGERELPPQIYGVVELLDEDTDTLCQWCRTHDVTKMSLELQLWWKRHHKADARRKRGKEKTRRQKRLREQALAKLTREERAALGIIER